MNQVSFTEHVKRNIVSGLIVATLVAFATWFVPGVWAYFGDTVQTSRLWYWFLLGFFILTVARLVARAIPRESVPHHAYTEDRFFGAVWRWNWTFTGAPDDISCFCPKCDRAMVYSNNHNYRTGTDSTIIFCRDCGKPDDEQLAIPGAVIRQGNVEETINAVRSEIDVKVRHKSWPGAHDPQNTPNA